jgi:uncharacterized coiled-coil DUF342 family protein
MTDIVERLRADLASGLSASLGDTKEAAAEIDRLRAERDAYRREMQATSQQADMLLAERDRLRRIPIHYGAPIDDPDAAIRWITGIMDAENGHLRKERDRMKRALEIIRDTVVDGVSFNTIARGGLGEDRT